MHPVDLYRGYRPDDDHRPGHSRALDITVGLAIATFKSSLVALIFMHLNSEKKLVYKVLLFTFIFFAGMMTLFVMAKMDPIKFTFYN